MMSYNGVPFESRIVPAGEQVVRVLFVSSKTGAVSFSGNARANQSVIKLPGLDPNYAFETEPHLVIDPFDHFTPGIGFRGTVKIVDNGFIKKINNTVGIGFGADWTNNDRIRIPVVMQWNFWLSRNWSVFGEPGGEIRFEDHRDRNRTRLGPVFFAGGRYHFTDTITLTMRVGHPVSSVGVSFLL